MTHAKKLKKTIRARASKALSAAERSLRPTRGVEEAPTRSEDANGRVRATRLPADRFSGRGRSVLRRNRQLLPPRPRQSGPPRRQHRPEARP